MVYIFDDYNIKIKKKIKCCQYKYVMIVKRTV